MDRHPQDADHVSASNNVAVDVSGTSGLDGATDSGAKASYIAGEVEGGVSWSRVMVRVGLLMKGDRLSRLPHLASLPLCYQNTLTPSSHKHQCSMKKMLTYTMNTSTMLLVSCRK